MGRGLCDMHWQRWRRHGDPNIRVRNPDEFHKNLGQICSVADCVELCKARGLCSTHYGRWLRTGTTDVSERQLKPPAQCAVEDCGKIVNSRGWCTAHYLRWQKYGDPLATKLKPVTITCIQDGCSRRVYKAGVCYRHHKELTEYFYQAQDGKCAICKCLEKDASRSLLMLDHDHKARRMRGLCCHSCNVGLGHFRDDPELLAAAIIYLASSADAQPIDP